MKRNLLLSIVAVVPAALMPLAGSCQIAPERAPAAERPAQVFNYRAYAGYAYTSLNQVDQSRFGLEGFNLSVTRDFGRFFGLTADGAYYWKALRGGTSVNPTGNPVPATVDLVLFGPELHVELYGHVSGFVHVLIGGAHTGGASEVPNISFAGGPGGGLEYSLGKRLAIRASGDNIISSFVEDPNHQGFSPHERSEPRAGIGVVYKF